jgi:hypothetical protein
MNIMLAAGAVDLNESAIPVEFSEAVTFKGIRNSCR